MPACLCVTVQICACVCVFAVCVCVACARVMHDEVSDTENIRKNLAIERMIVEGCDILLDTSQTFVRQGQYHIKAYRPRRESTTAV